MSWLMGVYYKAASEKKELPVLPWDKLGSLKTETYSLAWGTSNPKTLKTGEIPGVGSFVIIGFPLILQGDTYRCVTDGELPKILASEDRIRALEGHFLILIAEPERLRVYNDALGKRSLYISEDTEAYHFYSEISILKYYRKPEIDFENLGVYWHSKLPHHRFHYSPASSHYYKDVTVLPPGSGAILDGEFRIRSKEFLPHPSKLNPYRLLESCTAAPSDAGLKVALSFSGGMDMRSLLSIYLKRGIPFKAFYNGEEAHPDYQVARQVAHGEGFELVRVDASESWGEDAWKLLCEVKEQTDIFSNPCLANYYGFCRRIAKEADIMVSGYFGEIQRFKYMVPHMLSNFKLPGANREKLLGYLDNQPPTIFKPEITRQLKDGFERELRAAIGKMPKIVANMDWLDLFASRYTFITNTMPKLSYLDGFLVDYMPFMQKAILDKRWQHSVAYRLNESLHRGLIHRNAPQLRKYPLVLGSATAAFYHRQYMLKTRAVLQSRKASLAENATVEFLRLHKENVQDLFNSQKVRDYDAYDLPLIEKSLDKALKGDAAEAVRSLIWLSFELGR